MERRRRAVEFGLLPYHRGAPIARRHSRDRGIGALFAFTAPDQTPRYRPPALVAYRDRDGLGLVVEGFGPHTFLALHRLVDDAAEPGAIDPATA